MYKRQSVYKHDSHDEHSLQNNYVRILFEDKKGTFFVGTLNGLQTYDRATHRPLGAYCAQGSLSDGRDGLSVGVVQLGERLFGDARRGAHEEYLFAHGQRSPLLKREKESLKFDMLGPTMMGLA